MPHSYVESFAALGRGRPRRYDMRRVKTPKPSATAPRITIGT
jgi:hypothetical protein